MQNMNTYINDGDNYMIRDFLNQVSLLEITAGHWPFFD